MTLQLPKVTRAQLLQREEEWFRGSAVMSRSLGASGGQTAGAVLQPVKFGATRCNLPLAK